MTRIVHLDEHVGRVQSSVLELLDSPNCNLLLLSDVQVAVLAQMTFPYVRYTTRLILDRGQYQELVEMPQAYLDELECLELLLSGGATMTCDLSTVLAALAAAIRQQPAGGDGCAGSGPAAILNCVTSMTPEELIPQEEVEAPEYGVPPAGFDTWEQYTIHKCKAAYAIVDTVAGLFGALSLAPISALTFTAIRALLTGYLGGVALGATVFPPAAMVAIVAGAVALGILAGAAYIYLNDVKAYILDHKDELACSLYTSGSSPAAQAAIASLLEDAIQSVAWAAIFGPMVGGKIAGLLGGIAGQTVSNNLVNPLFRVVEDFVYPGVTCCGNGGPGVLEWHFDNSSQLWEKTFFLYGDDEAESYWANTFSPVDPEDSSPGLLYGWIQRGENRPGICNIVWTYEFPEEVRPVVVAGDKLKADFYCDYAATAYVTLYVVYTDTTFDYHTWGAPAGWLEHEIEASSGKTVRYLVAYFGVADAAVLRHFALDNVRWGQ